MSSMLEAIGGPPGAGAPPMGAPAGPPPEAEGPTDPTEILQEIIEGIKAYIDSDASDDIETQQAVKGLAIFQGLLADEQKGMEAASGTTPAHKAMAKQINSLASQAYGG